ncbi:response regulator [Telmatobacter sp. DSM 110680]|uniref:Response regulator n=1 Tax=Telmatobacter sp. DSM 110680 TaxID=3036704 RepID=A0AAU7DQK6_9BACT
MSDETVFIVDDDASICEGLSNLLDSVGIRTEQFSSAEAFWESWNDSRVGCMLLDARLPGASGVELQEHLNSLSIGLPIIFMTAHGDIPMVRKVMKAGAIEFLTKPFQKEELLHAVRQAFEQDRSRRREESIISAIKSRINSLTDREKEVMSMVTAGLLNKQIAAELNLSEITVKIHRRRVMDGMQAGSVAELVKMCERVKFPSRTTPA